MLHPTPGGYAATRAGKAGGGRGGAGRVATPVHKGWAGTPTVSRFRAGILVNDLLSFLAVGCFA